MKRTTKLLLICLPLLMLYSCKNTEPAATIAAPSVSVQSFPGSGKMLISWKPVETIENVDGYGVFRAAKTVNFNVCTKLIKSKIRSFITTLIPIEK